MEENDVAVTWTLTLTLAVTWTKEKQGGKIVGPVTRTSILAWSELRFHSSAGIAWGILVRVLQETLACTMVSAPTMVCYTATRNPSNNANCTTRRTRRALQGDARKIGSFGMMMIGFMPPLPVGQKSTGARKTGKLHEDVIKQKWGGAAIRSHEYWSWGAGTASI
jgi:hypothetical protein